jgi:hypothetical protein
MPFPVKKEIEAADDPEKRHKERIEKNEIQQDAGRHRGGD